MVIPANQNSIFADGITEPLRGAVQFTVGAGPAIAAGINVRAFVDSIGQSAAGGLVLVEGDYSLSGGYIPSGIGYEVHGLSCYMHQDTAAAVPADANILGLASNIWVRMYYANNYYDLGLLAEFMGPYGSPTGMNNVIFPHRFGWPWMRDERPIELEPGKQFWLQFTTLRALAAGVVAGNWVIRIVMPARKVAQGVAAVKQ